MAESEDYRLPLASYRDDPKRADNYTHVELHVPGIKKSVCGSKASNAVVVLETKETSFTMNIVLQARGSSTKYQYIVNQLPFPIHTDRKLTYWQTRKNIVDIYLAKVKPARWDTILTSVGLDQKP